MQSHSLLGCISQAENNFFKQLPYSSIFHIFLLLLFKHNMLIACSSPAYTDFLNNSALPTSLYPQRHIHLQVVQIGI